MNGQSGDSRGRGITFSIHAARLGDHVHLDVFSGRNPGARGKAGRLVLRVEEWEPFRALFDNEPTVTVEYVPEGSPRARWENL